MTDVAETWMSRERPILQAALRCLDQGASFPRFEEIRVSSMRAASAFALNETVPGSSTSLSSRAAKNVSSGTLGSAVTQISGVLR